jgi:hypothetical protein
MSATAAQAQAPSDVTRKTVFEILLALSACHFLNDALTSLLPSIYPILKDSLGLSFAQIGLITLEPRLSFSRWWDTIPIGVRGHTPWPVEWPSCWPGLWCCPSPTASMRSSSPELSSVPDRRYFTPHLHESFEWPPVGGSDWRSRSFSSAATQDLPPAPCSQPSLSCPGDKRALPRFRSWR